jgi:hypothetical protein
MLVLAVGFAAFVVEVNKRGWDVNFGKTVLGLNIYASPTEAETEAMRTEAADLFGSYQNDAGQGIAVEEEGMVFLGTPIGEERPDVTGPGARGVGGFQAAVPLGNLAYRERTLQGFIDDHDARLRQVVALSLYTYWFSMVNVRTHFQTCPRPAAEGTPSSEVVLEARRRRRLTRHVRAIE